MLALLDVYCNVCLSWCGYFVNTEDTAREERGGREEVPCRERKSKEREGKEKGKGREGVPARNIFMYHLEPEIRSTCRFVKN